jgi:hypothetical protein
LPHSTMTGMDERREVVNELSVDEARECLALIGEERVQHDAIHGFLNATVHNFVGEIVRKLDKEAREQLQRYQHDAVQRVRDIARKLAYRYPDENVHEQLLVDLDELDEHWRLKHPEEPEPGIEYFRRVVTEVRQHPR